jgi:chaperonin GroES
MADYEYTSPSYDGYLAIEDILENESNFNIAELLDKPALNSIGGKIVTDFEVDNSSNEERREIIEKALEHAKQTQEQKSYPWQNASNIKYPLITRAALDFASRTYPSLIRGGKVVHHKTTGADPLEVKAKRATRRSKFMNWQLLDDSPDWQRDMDTLTHVLPHVGLLFKKVYYDQLQGRVVSSLCSADSVIVNKAIKSAQTARRITHLYDLHANNIIEYMRLGVFIEYPIDEIRPGYAAYGVDSDPEIEILEQHCYLDLDGDGYEEPYIVTVCSESKHVLSITRRFEDTDIEFTDDGRVARIEPINYFIDYHCIPAPDGSFFSEGISTMLVPINETINTTINQLIDAGTLANTQGGFLGRGLRLRSGEFKVQPGEWKVLESAAGANIKDNIVPLPVKEPSSVLFSLLGLLVEVGKDLSTVQDVMMGKGQTQNVPATTILTMQENGLKVFSAIGKRLYVSLEQEFKAIARLNKIMADDVLYSRVLDEENVDMLEDFEDIDLDIQPVADPSMASMTQRLIKAQAEAQIVAGVGGDVQEAARNVLRAMDTDEDTINRLIPRPDPNAPPSPEQVKIQKEIEVMDSEILKNKAEAGAKWQLEAGKLKIQAQDAQARKDESEARQIKMVADTMAKEQDLELEHRKVDADLGKAKTKAQVDLIAEAMKAKKRVQS